MNEGKRQFERLSLYEKDVPPVKVEGFGKGFEAQLYDISPQGAGLFVSEKNWAGRELPESGARITLTIRLNKEEKFLVSAFICHVAPLQKVYKRGLKLGVTFINAGIAQSKNRSGLIWFLISIPLGPIATFLLITIFSGRP